jgi:xanthine dehydrogenase YagS FAD-binding subunit
VQSFEMLNPRTVEEAVGFLASYGPDARVYAGGQDLLYRFKRRLATNPMYLVNIKDIAGLRGLEPRDGALAIGPLTTLGELERSALVRDVLPMLHAAVAEIASPQIRNLGTVGGNLLQDVWCWYLLEDYDCWLNGGSYCYAATGEHQNYHSVMGGKHCIAAHPSDLAPALVALDATLRLASPSGVRTIPAESLWPGFTWAGDKLRNHTAASDELLVEVVVPLPSANVRSIFLKQRLRNSWDFALASLAMAIEMEDRRCVAARVVLGGVGTAPVRATAVEAALVGAELTDEVVARAAQQAIVGARPLRLSHYKLKIMEGLCRKALARLREEGDVCSENDSATETASMSRS